MKGREDLKLPELPENAMHVLYACINRVVRPNSDKDKVGGMRNLIYAVEHLYRPDKTDDAFDAVYALLEDVLGEDILRDLRAAARSM
jgi:hypothetical protein